jgi:hypothetical protein
MPGLLYKGEKRRPIRGENKKKFPEAASSTSPAVKLGYRNQDPVFFLIQIHINVAR